MEQRAFDVVTGAFSFTGRFIARRLAALERPIKTLTNHPQRAGAQEIQREIKAQVAPLQFTDRPALVESLRGADVLYNTYWVRFHHGRVRFGDAVANTRVLLGAARDAGVRKVVHISVSNPSEDSELDYYAGKARTERAVRDSGLAWAVVRPTLIFGPGDEAPGQVRQRCGPQRARAPGVDAGAARVAGAAARDPTPGQLAVEQRRHDRSVLRLGAGPALALTPKTRPPARGLHALRLP